MESQTTLRFRKAYSKLPEHTKGNVREAYKLWKKDPYHNSLQYKKIHTTLPIYSVRIGLAWRTLGTKQENTMIWFWIGSHADYDNLIKSL